MDEKPSPKDKDRTREWISDEEFNVSTESLPESDSSSGSVPALTPSEVSFKKPLPPIPQGDSDQSRPDPLKRQDASINMMRKVDAVRRELKVTKASIKEKAHVQHESRKYTFSFLTHLKNFWFALERGVGFIFRIAFYFGLVVWIYFYILMANEPIQFPFGTFSIPQVPRIMITAGAYLILIPKLLEMGDKHRFQWWGRFFLAAFFLAGLALAAFWYGWFIYFI